MLIIVGIIGVAFFSVTTFLASGGETPAHFTNDAFAETVVSTISLAQTTSSLPVRLRIPVISVDAVILPVGITSEGAMEAPKDPTETAWFALGPRPGEEGSAVIAGHFGWKDGEVAVFDKLFEVRKGDVLFVEDEGGVVYTFVVRELRSYEKDANASGIFSTEAGKTQLVLITCEGDWNKNEQSYTKRLVVFADLK